MNEMRIDFETRSAVDLKTCGAARYFACPHFKALIACYAIDDGPIQSWTYGRACPDDLRRHVEGGGFIRAFNASFERQCFDELARREGWPRPAIDRYRCTAAEAAAMALPRSLDAVGEALDLDVRKDKRGAALIRMFSVPRRHAGGEPKFNDPAEHAAEFREFIDYCRRDVEVEAAVAARVFPLSDYEQKLYTLDQVINSRGVRIDRASAVAAINLAGKMTRALDRDMVKATGGFVPACSNPGALVKWAAAQGVEMDSATKGSLEVLLRSDDLPATVREALELRQEAAKTSVRKLSSMLNRASDDGRVRGSFLMYGAGTGRWASTGVNFANLPRPRKIYEKAVEDGVVDTTQLFESFRREDPQLLSFLYGSELGRPLHLISDALRGFIWSAPGYDLMQADYTSIEGAVIAWSSGEDWKVQAMHDIAADPTLPDLYRRTAAAIMGMTTDEITKKHPYRQSVGKVSELALGFGGGVGAFHSMSQAYGVSLDPLYAPVWASADEERRAKAVKRYEACLKRGKERTMEMTREAWLACEIVKVGWRAANPAISGGWKLREEAMRDAIRNPGVKTSALKFEYLVTNGFLLARLPSGRCLFYGAPRLRDQVWARVKLKDGSWSDAEVMGRAEAELGERRGEVKIDGVTSPSVTALGVDSVKKKWSRFNLYGGLAAENDTQATARDLLVNGMLKAEEAGYPVVAHVYDEIIAEVPRGFGDLKDFERLICELPPWAAGMPLTASGWRGKRYRKD